VTTRTTALRPAERAVPAELRLRLPPAPPAGDDDAGTRPRRVSVGSSPDSETDVDVWHPASGAATAGIPAAHRNDGL